MLTDDDLWGGDAPATEAPPEPDADTAEALAEAGAPPAFCVKDEATASWTVNKMLQLDEQIERMTEQHLLIIRQLKAQRDRFRAWFTPQLRRWFEEQPKRGKTLMLLTGTLKSRSVVGSPKIEDEAAVMAWAETELPAAIIPIPASRKLDGNAVRAAAKGGQTIPGVEWTPDREEFDIVGPKAPKKED